MSVKNIGDAAASNVSGTPLIQSQLSGAPIGVLQLLTPTAYASIASGASALFTYTLTASGAGTISFSAGALAMDANSGLPVSAANKTSNSIVLYDAARLTADISVAPSLQVNNGQLFTIYLTVSNIGIGVANNIKPSALTLVSVSGGNVSGGGVTPASVPSLNPGLGTVFTYSYQASAPGSVYFSGSATGTDTTLLPVSSNITNTAAILIQAPAALSASLLAPLTVDTNQVFNVAYSLTNTSGPLGETLLGATASDAASTFSGDVGPSSGPVPGPVNIPGGVNQAYTYSVTAGAVPGVVTISASVTSTAQNTLLPVSVTASQLVIVQNPASLTLSSQVVPASASVNKTQMITLVLTVSNTGQALLNNISFANPVTVGGVVTLLSSPVAPVTRAGGASARFTWTYSSDNVGVEAFSLAASGTDVNSGAWQSRRPCRCTQ